MSGIMIFAWETWSVLYSDKARKARMKSWKMEDGGGRVRWYLKHEAKDGIGWEKGGAEEWGLETWRLG